MVPRSRRDAARPFSIRFTESELANLKLKAGSKPLGAFVRERLLGDVGAQRDSARRAPRADEKALARLLAMLGASEMGGNLAQIVRFAETGVLPVDDSMARELGAASAAILEMRWLLLQALGRRVPAPPDAASRPESLSDAFTRAAGRPGDRP